MKTKEPTTNEKCKNSKEIIKIQNCKGLPQKFSKNDNLLRLLS